MTLLSFDHQDVDFEALASDLCAGVECLSIAFSPVRTLQGIGRLSSVRELRIHYCRNLADISAIDKLSELETVVLYGTPKLFDCSPLVRCLKLAKLSLNGPYNIESIKGIENLLHLEYLQLSRVKVADGDFQPIIKSPSLRRVFWHGAPFKPPALARLREARPEIVFGGNASNQT